MTDSHCLVSVPVTPDYVLAVFRDQHRQFRRFDFCCDSEIDLTFDSTIAEWRAAMDLLPTRQLGRAENACWNIRLSDREWRDVLHPPHRKTLRGVAELIARHTQRPELRPLPIAGVHCLPAAAFLATKEFLAGDGADVSDLAPSSLLSDYARKHLATFLTSVSQLAPGALPDVEFKLPDDGAAMTLGCVQIGLLLALITWLLGGESLPLIVIAAVLQLTLIVAGWFQKPQALVSVRFGELLTFRDLAQCIAAGSR